MPVWDSVNQVLYFVQYTDPDGAAITLHVYDPRTARWTFNVPMNVPKDGPVRGRHAIFDPIQNVLLVMGAKLDKSPRIFLWRYAEDKR
jgi:hypothetical protein